MAVKSLKKYIAEVEKETKSDYQKALDTSNKNFETQKTETTNTYNKQIDNTADSYENLYRENAVQKHINELEVAENMANLGLTDSGLNRTQQTAIQLSYANNKNTFDVSRQKAIDGLTSELASKISEIDINKSNAAQSIKDSWDSQNLEIATKMRDADIEAETERYKAQQEQIEASNKAYYSAQQKIITNQQKLDKENSYIIKVNDANLSYEYKGSLKDNGVTVRYDTDTTTYVDTKSGKKTTVSRGTNPYTGSVNKDLLNSGVYDKSKAFDNGYQPNNIGGKSLTKIGTVDLTEKFGRTQNVFKTPDGKCWIWSGGENKYIRVKGSGTNWEIM